MNEAAIVRKLTHLQIKLELGLLSTASYKGEVTKIGRKQKYPRELGLLANQVTRTLLDIVQEYHHRRFTAVNRYVDLYILAGTELHLVTIDFDEDSEPPTDGVVEPTRGARGAIHEANQRYKIDRVALTKVYAYKNTTNTLISPIQYFL